MANNSLIYRFTDERYATRFELAQTLGTNLIDPIWNEILKYRNTMKVNTCVQDVMHMPLFFVNTEKIKEKIKINENLLTRFSEEYEKMLGGTISKNIFRKEMFRISLRVIAKLHNIEVSDVSLDKVIDHKSFDITHLPIARYMKAIEQFNDTSLIDEQFLADNFALLRGESELTAFYRVNDIESPASKYLISKEYIAAPVKDIEFLVNNLFDYLNNSNDSKIQKIAMILYMFNYVKPFETLNEEMCLILVNKIIGKNCLYAPIEAVLSLTNNQQLMKEIQKTRDVTYLLSSLNEILEKNLISGLDKIVQINGKDVRQTYLAGDDKEEFKKEFGIEPPKEAIPPKVKVEEIIHQPKVETRSNDIKKDYSKEKELKQKTNDLLENDPYLKKGQAHFYVRHCEKGKYYTIQQYKKEERCVYETARTSMDNLAKLGYYRREQIKNKFVYTPIER